MVPGFITNYLKISIQSILITSFSSSNLLKLSFLKKKNLQIDKMDFYLKNKANSISLTAAQLKKHNSFSYKPGYIDQQIINYSSSQKCWLVSGHSETDKAVFFSTTKCVFFITHKDKEFLVALISSLKTASNSLVKTLRCHSGYQRDYLQWEIFRIKKENTKQASCVCKQQYNPSFIYVLKKNTVKQLIPLGQSLDVNFKMS